MIVVSVIAVGGAALKQQQKEIERLKAELSAVNKNLDSARKEIEQMKMIEAAKIEKAEREEREQQERLLKARKEREQREKREELAKKSANVQVKIKDLRKLLVDGLKSEGLDIVKDVALDSYGTDMAVVTVKPIWHNRNRHLRENDYWVMLAAWRQVTGDKKAHLKIQSINGETVARMGFLGGVVLEEDE
jgi:predicted RNase H-like nuclease (RuvC/YqgF family)